jgi:hypothetical protein
LLRRRRVPLILATATLAGALSGGIAAPAFAATTPTQGVGVQLTDTALVNFPTNANARGSPSPTSTSAPRTRGKSRTRSRPAPAGRTTVTPASAVLAPGASYTATVTVTVPAGTPAGPQVQSAKPGTITLATNAGIREYLTVSS